MNSLAVLVENAPAGDLASGAAACLLDRRGRVVAADAAVRGWIFDGRQAAGTLADQLVDNAQVSAALEELFGEAGRSVVEGTLPAVGGPSLAVHFQMRRLDGELGPIALVTFDRERSPTAVAVDALTGLPDRRAIAARAADWRHGSADQAAAFAVLFLDLDDFKSVNDRHGHATGDRVLEELAQRWVRCVRDDDLVARYGGDEFVVLLKDIASAIDAEPIVRRLKESTSEPIDFGELQVHVTATIGIVAGKSNGATVDDLVDAADRDMYARKRCKAQ
jgi:diguanylate cyclase (GGDEF)-like protein